MVLDLICISFIVYYLLSGILVIYLIIITIIIIITVLLYIYFFFYTYLTLLGATSLTLCIFGGIHISDLALLFYLFLL